MTCRTCGALPAGHAGHPYVEAGAGYTPPTLQADAAPQSTPAGPDVWPEPGDPRRADREAAAARLDAYEATIEDAARGALGEWLDVVAAAVLEDRYLTAAAGDGIPPDPGAIPALGGTWAKLAGRIVRAIDQLLTDVFANLLGDAHTFSSRPWQEDYLDTVANRLVHVADETFDIVRTVVQDGIDAGASIPRLREGIQTVLDMQGETSWANRAQTIARTETIGAYNGGHVAAWRIRDEETGEETHKVWLATIDPRTRPSHFRADGQRVPLDGHFRVGGHELDHPGDPTGPAEEVINCRCTMLELDADEDTPDTADRQLADPAKIQAEIDRRAEDGQTRAYDQPADDGVQAAAGATADQPTPARPAEDVVLMQDALWRASYGDRDPLLNDEEWVDPARITELLGALTAAAVRRVDLPEFEEGLHPRDANGRFIPKDELPGFGGTFTAPTENLARATWQHQLTGSDGKTYRTELRNYLPNADDTGGSTYVDFLNDRGEVIGAAIRYFKQTPDGPRIRHDIMKIEPEYQGLGLGSEFNRRAEEAYRAAGITHVTTEAASEPEGGYIGAYVWARRGFVWSDHIGPRSVAKKLRDLSPKGQNPHIDTVIEQLEAARITTRGSELPSPFEVSELRGKRSLLQPDAPIGQAALLSAVSWHGVRWLPAEEPAAEAPAPTAPGVRRPAVPADLAVGALVYKGNGKVAYRVWGVRTDDAGQPTQVGLVKATTDTDPTRSTWWNVGDLTVEAPAGDGTPAADLAGPAGPSVKDLALNITPKRKEALAYYATPPAEREAQGLKEPQTFTSSSFGDAGWLDVDRDGNQVLSAAGREAHGVVFPDAPPAHDGAPDLTGPLRPVEVKALEYWAAPEPTGVKPPSHVVGYLEARGLLEPVGTSRWQKQPTAAGRAILAGDPLPTPAAELPPAVPEPAHPTIKPFAVGPRVKGEVQYAAEMAESDGLDPGFTWDDRGRMQITDPARALWTLEGQRSIHEDNALDGYDAAERRKAKQLEAGFRKIQDKIRAESPDLPANAAHWLVEIPTDDVSDPDRTFGTGNTLAAQRGETTPPLAGHDALDASWQAAPTPSPAQRTAAADYAASGAPEPSDALADLIDASPAPAPLEVWRGTSDASAFLGKDGRAAGGELSTPGLLSTTTDREAVATALPDTPDAALIRLTVPEGNPALPLDRVIGGPDATPGDGHREIVLPPDTTLHVTSDQRDDTGTRVITADVLPKLTKAQARDLAYWPSTDGRRPKNDAIERFDRLGLVEPDGSGSKWGRQLTPAGRAYLAGASADPIPPADPAPAPPAADSPHADLLTMKPRDLSRQGPGRLTGSVNPEVRSEGHRLHTRFLAAESNNLGTPESQRILDDQLQITLNDTRTLLADRRAQIGSPDWDEERVNAALDEIQRRLDARRAAPDPAPRDLPPGDVPQVMPEAGEDDAGWPYQLSYDYLESLTPEDLDDLTSALADGLGNGDPRDEARWDALDRYLTVRDHTDELAAQEDTLGTAQVDRLIREYQDQHGIPGVTHPDVGGQEFAAKPPTRKEVQAEYATFLETQYLAAQEATNGHMLNARGATKNVHPRELFGSSKVPIRDAVAWASEELLQYWENNPRISWAEYYYERTGAEAWADRAAKMRTRNASISRDRTNPLLAAAGRRPGGVPSDKQRAAYAAGRDAYTQGEESTALPYSFTDADPEGLRLLWVRGYVQARHAALLDQLTKDGVLIPPATARLVWRGAGVPAPTVRHHPTPAGKRAAKRMTWQPGDLDVQPAEPGLTADPAPTGHTVIAAGSGPGDSTETPEPAPMPRTWKSAPYLAPFAAPTGDGRIFKVGSLSTRELPLPLLFQPTSGMGHDGSVVVGRILAVEMTDAGIAASGDYLEADPEKAPDLAKAIEQAVALTEQGLGHVSVDLSDVVGELVDEDGNQVTLEEIFDAWDRGEDPKVLEQVIEGKLIACTQVATPAFEIAKIELAATVQVDGEAALTDDGGAVIAVGAVVDVDTDGGAVRGEVTAVDEANDTVTVQPTDADGNAAGDPLDVAPAAITVITPADGTAGAENDEELAELTASPGPLRPPAAWFEDPKLAGPTALTITDDGRVYGHAALWDVCHVGFSNTCVTPPPSPSNYRHFHTGEVVCDDGTRVAVGNLTLGGKHADVRLAYRSAIEHYDTQGAGAAVVRMYEDEFGIVFAGALTPGVSEEQLYDLRRSPVSGDWRKVGGQLELIGVLSVNSPGFPTPRFATDDSGRVALTAAPGVRPAEDAPSRPRRTGLSQAELIARLTTEVTAQVREQLHREQAEKVRADRLQRIASSIRRDPRSRLADLAATVDAPKRQARAGRLAELAARVTR